jgi:hypothetical protein
VELIVPPSDAAVRRPLWLPLIKWLLAFPQGDGGADASQGYDHLHDGDDKNGIVGAGA